jgi:two-component system response regulator AtoC
VPDDRKRNGRNRGPYLKPLERQVVHELSKTALQHAMPRDSVGAHRGHVGVITRTTISDESEGERPTDGGAGLHLLIMSPDSFTTLPLPNKGVLSLGRSTRSDVQIEDPMASREHGRLHLDAQIYVEDLGSANGTRVRDLAIEKGALVPINPGEGVTIGSTVLMVQHNRSHVGRQRLWSHAYFEGRLEAECSRAEAGGASFALARLRLDRPLPWTTLAPVFAHEVPPPHLFGAYGPDDYELLLLEKTPDELERLLANIRRTLEMEGGSEVRTPVAWFPRDGRSADALIAHVNGLLRRNRPDAATASVAAASEERSTAMARVHDLALRAAPSTINVLIMGETGVGKDVMARMIHGRSARAHQPFVALNCAGLSEALIESELFGHERGSFTGAAQQKLGLLETAEGGTVFLDEVGELPLTVQAKLLRVIELREVLRVGAIKTHSIDVRFIAATNRDLEAEVLQGRFRRDLFFRLNGISLTIPPLRERLSEIEPLARTFVTEACAESGRIPPVMGDAVLDVLESYSWPGNIRELKNYMDRALVLCEDEILPAHLPLEKMTHDARRYVIGVGLNADTLPVSERRRPTGDPRRDERQRMLDALAAWGGNQTRAAESMGMPRRTFVSKLDRYGFPRPRKRETPTGNGLPAVDAAAIPPNDPGALPGPRPNGK